MSVHLECRSIQSVGPCRNGTILEIYKEARSTLSCRPWRVDEFDRLEVTDFEFEAASLLKRRFGIQRYCMAYVSSLHAQCRNCIRALNRSWRGGNPNSGRRNTARRGCPCDTPLERQPLARWSETDPASPSFRYPRETLPSAWVVRLRNVARLHLLQAAWFSNELGALMRGPVAAPGADLQGGLGAMSGDGLEAPRGAGGASLRHGRGDGGRNALDHFYQRALVSGREERGREPA